MKIKFKKTFCFLIAVSLCLGLTACNGLNQGEEGQKSEWKDKIEKDTELIEIPIQQSKEEQESNEQSKNEVDIIDDGNKEPIYLKFIDVGQADSSVIVTSNNDVILIDTGDSRDAKEVIEGLSEFTFEDIDLMILTHPHADHIGGAETILKTYNVKEVLMSSFVTNTKVFNGILDTLEEQTDVKVTQAVLGMTYDIDGVHLEVVGVDSISKDNNNSSVIVKATYGDISALYTGDLESDGEEIVLSNGFDLDSDILKVGHHGSDTSTSDEFLQSISPKLAVISVGENNKYSHPSDITLKKLKENNIQYYRTDESGSIKLEVDGVNIIAMLEDNFILENTRSNRNFLFEPDVADVGLEDESVVIDEAIQNRINDNCG